MRAKPIVRFLPIFFLLIFFACLLFFVMKRTQAFNFPDESEHLTPALMMTWGKALYLDLSTNHQPLPIITAVAFWKFVTVDNFFMLIERVRQFMFVLSFLGALAVTLRFKWKGLIAVVLIETSKFYFFGFHLLSESLVVYPIVFLAGEIFERALGKGEPSKSAVTDVLFGVSIFWVAFNLLPLWPFLAVASAYYLFLRKSIKSVLRVVFSFLLLSCVLFLFVPIQNWFIETIVNNILYFLPYESHLSQMDYVKILLFPFFSVLGLGDVVAKLYFLLTVASVSLVAFLGLTKNLNRQIFIFTAAAYVMLILLNLRVPTSSVSFYSAFHLLPQHSFFIVLAVFLGAYVWSKIQFKKGQVVFLVATFGWSLTFLFSASPWLLESIHADKAKEHFINFESEESTALAVLAISKPRDGFLAGPQSYLNVATELPLVTKQTAYLPWAFRSNELRDDFNLKISKRAPSFVFFPSSDNPYFKSLSPTLAKNYFRIRRSFGKDTDLYVSKSKAIDVDPEQWRRFEVLLYEKPIMK